jgi:hypothetical protein
MGSQSTVTDGQEKSEPVIPSRFTHAIDEHLVFSFAGVTAWPLVLGIFGRPGDGKSFQARTHLKRLGVQVFSINAADLESDRAGTPGKLVLDTYINAGHRTEEGTPTVLVVDDFDTTVGEWAHSTTTVNHQQILAQLMHLADSPTEAAGKKLRRVPVIITGNDLSKVYPPLRRPGRMRSFPWVPSLEERNEIIAGILADVLPSEEIPGLIRCVPNAPIAFYSDLLVDLIATVSHDRVRDLVTDLPTLLRPGNEHGELLRRQAINCRLSAVQIGELAIRAWQERQQATQSYLEN